MYDTAASRVHVLAIPVLMSEYGGLAIRCTVLSHSVVSFKNDGQISSPVRWVYGGNMEGKKSDELSVKRGKKRTKKP